MPGMTDPQIPPCAGKENLAHIHHESCPYELARHLPCPEGSRNVLRQKEHGWVVVRQRWTKDGQVRLGRNGWHYEDVSVMWEFPPTEDTTDLIEPLLEMIYQFRAESR